MVWIANGCVMPTAASASTVSGRAPMAAKPLGAETSAVMSGVMSGVSSWVLSVLVVSVVPLQAARAGRRGSQRTTRACGRDLSGAPRKRSAHTVRGGVCRPDDKHGTR